MKKLFSENILVQFIFLSLVVFFSRLPFLWAGFGAEEDSWLLPLTAKHIAQTGMYEMSRAPGHPLQELIYSLIWNAGPFAYNLLSAIASVVSVVFFALALRRIGFKHYLFAAFAFAFTPIVFISSTYTIDYMPAMACVMGGFYFLTSPPSPELRSLRRSGYPQPAVVPKEEKPARAFPPLWGGIGWGALFLGIAIGFRLTSAAMLIPFCIWLFPSPPYKGGKRGIGLFVFLTLLIAFFSYLPVLKTYGLSFFHYSDQFPYPNLLKILYKATIGTFGVIGILTIFFFKVNSLSKIISLKGKIVPSGMPVKLFWASVAAIIIYILSYLRLPQKSAYLLPIIPFFILIFGYFLSSPAFKTFCVLLTMSSFLFSINLTDSLRGSRHSPLAIQFKIAGQEIFIDPLTGPVFADYTKRLNKMAFTEKIYEKTMNEKRKVVLICGWWYNELQVRNWDSAHNSNVIPVFYINQATMEKYIAEGYEISYLPEQNLYNDQYSKMQYTDTAAKPYL